MYLYPNLYDEKLFNAPTLYDAVERYGYTVASLLGNYPIWDETKRDWLNGEIYGYFAYREIGAESVPMFSSYAKRAMNRVMPKVNSIAAFALAGSDNWDVSMIESMTGETTHANTVTGSRSDMAQSVLTDTYDRANSTSNTTTSESKATAITSDTPQVMLSSTENYMSSGTESGSSGTGTSATMGTDTGTVTHAQSSNGSGSSSSEDHGISENTAERTQAAGQLSELASRWAATMPDLLGIIFEALETCFCQVF